MAKSTAFKPKTPKGVITPGTPEVETPSNTEVVSDETTQEDTAENIEGDISEDITDEDTAQEDTAQEDEVGESETEKEVEEKPSAVSFVHVEEKTIPDQRVKIRISYNYNCTIGGERYFFEKDKIYTVPNNVKVVLSEELNLLKPL